MTTNKFVMKYIIVCVLLTVAGLTAVAQEKPQYAVSAIPDSMKKDVNSVVREQSYVMAIRRPGKAKLSIKKVVTVLNEKAEDELVFYTHYDQFRKIDDIEINIYDATGKYIRRSRKKDLVTQSVGDGFSLVTDSKVIYADLRSDKYPVTIEINYDINFEGMLRIPEFYPQTSEQSIMHNYYSITTSTDNKVRHKNYRCAVKPVIKEDGSNITYTWEVKNVQPFYKEPGSAEEDIPRVQIAPTLFEMDDYPGSLSSWKNYGLWINSLNNKIDVLPEQSRAFYRELVKNAGSDREKVAILYKHMQDNYRYVSIQLGIGGLKPFPAEFVEKKKYGDCKALSNFMHAMLSAVNIRSHYTVINAGYNSMAVEEDFPEDRFNHIILCVPLAKDTVWLECTSRTQPFGKLGNFTENRRGLLATETGGVLVTTPKSEASDNVMHTNTFVELLADGSGKATVDIRHTGEYTDMANHVLEADEQNKKSFLINRIGYKQPDRIQISKKNSAGQNDFVLHYDMEFEKVPEFSAGTKHFMNPRMYKFWNRALPKAEKRENDYYLEYPLMASDSTVFQLPEGYFVETLPKAASIKCAIGNYEATYFFDADKRQLITNCRMTVATHIIPAKLYAEAAKFFSDVISEQQQKIVVKKQ
jgi:hypothetical protein